MKQLLIPEIDLNEFDKHILKDFHILPRQESSWRIALNNINGIIELFKQIGIVSEGESATIIHQSVRVCQNEDDLFNSLTEYFRRFLNNSLTQMGLDSASPDNSFPLLLTINFMPFFIGPANSDRIISGICQELTDKPQLSDSTLILLARQHELFSRSEDFKSFIQSDSKINSAVIIDLDGNVRTIKKNNKEEYPEEAKDSINRSTFEKILHFQSETSFRNALIYQTNINIGHFELGSCHVRTHYDLKDFIKRDNVFEHIYNDFSQTIIDYDNICVIGTGLEVEALTILGNRLQATFNDNQSKVATYSTIKNIIWKGHYSFGNVREDTEQIKNILQGFDCIVLLTDVINSGSTIQYALSLIEDVIEQDIPKDKKPKLLVYSLVQMNNSKGVFKAAVKINRPYLDSDPDKCPLCKLKQPLKKVDPLNWEKDFLSVDELQLTPLDFWEMVYDCDALVRNKQYLSGGFLVHRIDTKKLIERYEHFLSNIISRKVLDHWYDNQPDVILTVNQDPSRGFARLVLKSLKNPLVHRLYIPRSVLNGVSIPSERIDRKLQLFSEEGKRILIVDDGINRCSTLESILALLNRYRCKTIGVLVLDSRLTNEKKLEIERSLKDFKIVALYTWPSVPIFYTNLNGTLI